MLSFIGFALHFMVAASGVDSIHVDRLEQGTYQTFAVIEVNSEGHTVNVPTVETRGGLREGQRIGCETVGPRLDGTKVVICGGSVAAYIDTDGSRRANPYFKGTTYTVSNRCEQD